MRLNQKLTSCDMQATLAVELTSVRIPFLDKTVHFFYRLRQIYALHALCTIWFFEEVSEYWVEIA
jgi:hypothetical protein